MAPATRRSARKQASPSPQDSLSASTGSKSPYFSRDPSSLQTPASSEIDDEPAVPSRPRKSRLKRTASQVTADSEDLDNSGAEDDSPLKSIKRPAAKRRVTAPVNRAYVELPPTRRTSARTLSAPIQSKTSSAKGKGKARAIVESEGEGSGLEYDDEESLQMSESTDSEFNPEENDQDAGDDDYAQDSEDEALMLEATLQQSRAETNANQSGSSRVSSRPRNAAARLRAAAAERRRGDAMDVDEDSDELTDFEDESESDVPLSKGKGKATVRNTSAPTSMSLAELRKARREEKTRLRQELEPVKKLEKAKCKELGRKLTHAEKSSIALQYHHPELKDVWGDLKSSIPIIEPTEALQPGNLKLSLLPFQKESLYWMQKQEQGVWKGGMLADEMGMGKTIQIIALLVSGGRKPNLVVAPTVAIMQWRNEIQAHTDGLKVAVWHGASRESDIKALKNNDVVLTTYAVLESSFRKQEKGFTRKNLKIVEKSPVHQITWDRIILDEAHNIKERSTNTAKAAFELKANYRWCLSGTPLQNRVGELYSLVRFLGGDPFSYYFCKRCDCKSLHWKFSDKRSCDDCGHSPMFHTCFWNNEILTPIQKWGMDGPGKPAFKKLKVLLDRMMLRRTKLQRADDLGLPPRTVVVRRDHFSPEEKELYLSLFSDAKRQFTTYLDQGTILNNYSNIFSLLTRMRQMACHPDLVLRSKTSANRFLPEEAEATVCRLCNDIVEDAIQSKCRHVFDRECIKQYLNTAIQQTPDCPVCHLPLTIDLEAPALDLDNNMQATSRQGILGRLNLDTWRSSTKIEALVEELSNLRLQDATTKSIVFSQFVNFLDLIAYRLKRAGFNICRLEGTMSPQARDATIKHFMNNVGVTVFLVSLKAGGVALNLTEASRVYLMDSWWNPAVEFRQYFAHQFQGANTDPLTEAMDRIHRLGQHRPVQAIKLVVEDSIESRIVQLQEKKSAMVDATLSTDDSAMGRLTPEDLGFLFRL